MPEMRAETEREARRKGIEGATEKAVDPYDLISSSVPADVPRTKPSEDDRPGVDVSEGRTRPRKR